MNQYLEVVTAKGDKSRLTVTPTRVTVKVARIHEKLADRWLEAAIKVSEDIGKFEKTFRGELVPGSEHIVLATGKGKAGSSIRVYSFNGELIDSRVRGEKTAQLEGSTNG